VTTSQAHRPAHGGYPGEVPSTGFSLDLRKGDGGYRVRVVDPEYPIDHPVVFGSESEEYVATFAGLVPEVIVFVTEEALA
jgi:hypothetical protein